MSLGLHSPFSLTKTNVLHEVQVTSYEKSPLIGGL